MPLPSKSMSYWIPIQWKPSKIHVHHLFAPQNCFNVFFFFSCFYFYALRLNAHKWHVLLHNTQVNNRKSSFCAVFHAMMMYYIVLNLCHFDRNNNFKSISIARVISTKPMHSSHSRIWWQWAKRSTFLQKIDRTNTKATTTKNISSQSIRIENVNSVSLLW